MSPSTLRTILSPPPALLAAFVVAGGSPAAAQPAASVLELPMTMDGAYGDLPVPLRGRDTLRSLLVARRALAFDVQVGDSTFAAIWDTGAAATSLETGSRIRASDPPTPPPGSEG
jgi:hypothetical protein